MSDGARCDVTLSRDALIAIIMSNETALTGNLTIYCEDTVWKSEYNTGRINNKINYGDHY